MKTTKNKAQQIVSITIFFVLFFTITQHLKVSDAFAGTILSERIVWKPARFVDAGKEGKRIPFKITGPGILQIRWTIEPFYCVQYPMKSDSVFGIPGLWNFGWKLVRSEHLYDGKPLENYKVASACYIEGKIKKATFFDEFEIPAKTTTGEFAITSPLSCSHNACDRRGADFWAEAKFIAGQGQTGSTAGPVTEKPKPGTTTGSQFPAGTQWSAGAIDKGVRISPHHAPWVFHENGVIEAPGYWKGTWTSTPEGYLITLVHQGVKDTFLVKFSADKREFTAFKNGVPYRYGIRK